MQLSVMTVFAAARQIKAAESVAWSVALSWAHQCKAEAAASVERKLAEKRSAFFVARKKALHKDSYLERVRSAKVLTGKERASEGGWAFQQVGDIDRERKGKQAFGDNVAA
jgi:hypothetical protein